MQKAAVVVAGGSGKRMGSTLPKQFLPLAGKPVLAHTMKRFLDFEAALRIVLVLPEASIAYWKELAAQALSEDERARIRITSGGEQRTDSVEKGLQALEAWITDPSDCLVAIHDGVRPFATPVMLAAAYAQAQKYGAAVACVKVKSSLREWVSDTESKAIDRSRYLHVQTPQTFVLDKILLAYAGRPHNQFTDDASLYEEVIGPVSISEGSYENIKITTPEDLFVAEGLLRRERKSQDRLAEQKQKIKLILLDIDGTMTDGGMYYSQDGVISKRFNVKDGMAIHRMITRYGMQFGLISSDPQPEMVAARAAKLGVQRHYSGKTPKMQIIATWCEELGIGLENIGYVGDDLNDLEVIQAVGLGTCPADAVKEVRAAADLVLSLKGGEGCVRELIEEVLAFDLNVPASNAF